MNKKRHKYEYQIDIQGTTAPARVVRMVGENKRVLEIGAGPGSITKLLKSVNNCSVIALERDKSAIEKLTRYCDRVVQADLNDPLWPQLLSDEQAFDVLVCADVLEHVYDPAEVLAGISGFMGGETSLVVSLPHVGHSAIHACLFESDFNYRDWGLLDRTHIRFFGFTNIEELFRGADLKIVHAEFVTCEPEQTEFAEYWKKLPESLKRELRMNPLGLVYQVVVRVVPLASPYPAVDLRTALISANQQSPRKLKSQWLRSFVRSHTSPAIRGRIRHFMSLIGFKKV